MELYQRERVEVAVQAILTEWHGHLSTVCLQAEVEFRRNKPLRIETVCPEGLGVGNTGCALALFDCDLICLRNDLEPDRAIVTLGHECGHFVLGHVPYYSSGIGHLTYDEFIRSPAFQDAHHRGIGRYDKNYEQAAELFGTLVFEAIESTTREKQREGLKQSLRNWFT